MSFTSPPDPIAFRAQVWEIVRQIPPGKVATYGQIARLVPVPAGVSPDSYRSLGPRWVGSAMAASPENVPWQRVINSQGKISLPGESGAHQRQLLLAEGVLVDDRQRIDLKRYGWNEPDDLSAPRLPGF